MGFPGGSAGKESACNVDDLGSIPGLGRFPWRRERLPNPVFWPGGFHGLCMPWGHRLRHDRVTFTFQVIVSVDIFHFLHFGNGKIEMSATFWNNF